MLPLTSLTFFPMKRGLSILCDEFDHSTICAWVKFGGHVSMAEARTQNYVAQFISHDTLATVRVPKVYLSFEWKGFGYIVMEYIDGQVCTYADAGLVATAVRYLIETVKPPAAQAPGPVGGGFIRNDFFLYRESSVPYSSVEILEKHINKASANLTCLSLETELIFSRI
jgi:hypothetical protein